MSVINYIEALPGFISTTESISYKHLIIDGHSMLFGDLEKNLSEITAQADNIVVVFDTVLYAYEIVYQKCKYMKNPAPVSYLDYDLDSYMETVHKFFPKATLFKSGEKLESLEHIWRFGFNTDETYLIWSKNPENITFAIGSICSGTHGRVYINVNNSIVLIASLKNIILGTSHDATSKSVFGISFIMWAISLGDRMLPPRITIGTPMYIITDAKIINEKDKFANEVVKRYPANASNVEFVVEGRERSYRDILYYDIIRYLPKPFAGLPRPPGYHVKYYGYRSCPSVLTNSFESEHERMLSSLDHRCVLSIDGCRRFLLNPQTGTYPWPKSCTCDYLIINSKVMLGNEWSPFQKQ